MVPFVKTAVVILNWNGKKFLKAFLPKVLEHTLTNNTGDVRVFVADNGSTDGSVEFLNNRFPEVPTILLYQNYGYAEGYNRALQQIDATYFVLLNSDIETTPGWLLPLVDMMDNDISVAACAPKLKDLNNHEFFEYAGAAGGFMDRFGYVFCRGRLFHTCEKDLGQYDRPGEIFWATGACLMIRAEAFRNAGGLDPSFFAHMEEIDLCWRLKNMGFKIMYQPLSVVYHLGGGTLPASSARKTFLNYRNNLLMMHKNLPRKNAGSILFMRKTLDFISGMVFLLQGNPVIIQSVWKAHFAYRKAIKTLYNKDSLRSLRPEAFPKGILKQSIVFEYFIKGVRSFSKLRPF